MNSQVGKSMGIALLLAVGLLAALLAWSALPASAQDEVEPSVTVEPATAMPGGTITVNGSDFLSAATTTEPVRIYIADDDDVTVGEVIADAAVTNPADPASLSTAPVVEFVGDEVRTFVEAFILGVDVEEGEYALIARDDGGEVLAETDFTVEYMPTIKLDRSEVNNAVGGGVIATLTQFTRSVEADTDGSGTLDIVITVTDSEGQELPKVNRYRHSEKVETQVVTTPIEIPEDTPAGELTFTATQGDNVATAILTVVAPSITLDRITADNGEPQKVTISGVDFGDGSDALDFTEITFGIKDSADMEVDVDDLEASDFEADDSDMTAFTQTFTIPAGTAPVVITVSAEVEGDYIDDATFKLTPAAPGQVTGVFVSGGERSLAVTWVEVKGSPDGDTLLYQPTPDGYKVEWKLAIAPFWPPENVEEVPDGTQVYHVIDDEDLIPGQQYMVRVRAITQDAPDGDASVINQNSIGVPTALTRGELVNRPDLDATIDATNSDTPGGRVRVELGFHAAHEVNLSDRIVVNFGSFGVPDSIDESRVDLRVWGRDDHDGETRQPYEGNPDDVTVDGSEVTLVLGTLENDNATPATVNRLQEGAEVEITFRESAGITNPTTANDDEGNYSIGIDADGPIGRTADADGNYPDRNFGEVVRKVSVSPTSASRGSEITVTGKGFGSGTATVFLDDKAGDTTLSREAAITNGSFEVTLDVGADFNAGDNTINAIDGAGNEAEVDNAAAFTVTSKISVSPSEVALSEEVTISVSDWSEGFVDGITFGGLTAAITRNTTGAHTDSGEIDFIVPDNARIGVNKVVLLVDGESQGSVSVTVEALSLSVSPATAVPGQRVTISGSGFASAKDVTEITFGDVTLTGADIPDDASSTSAGRVAVTIEMPLDVSDGEKKVVLKTEDGKVGEGTFTVPEPSVTVNPEESLIGSVIAVTGSGFASGERVEVLYGGHIEEVGVADGSGDVSIRVTVPNTAGIGETNEVEVQVREEPSIKASADHKTPDSMITLTPEVRSGGLITISGTNFAGFSTLSEVMVGGHDVKPSPAPETDKNGRFEFEARVPRLTAGSHTVSVKDGLDNSATESFRVVTTAIISTPEEVFGSLGDNLVVVWRYDNATATWASYSPMAPEINDLDAVSSGTIVWVHLSEAAEFQGETLIAGWQLIVLE